MNWNVNMHMKEQKSFTDSNGLHRIEFMNHSRYPEFFLPISAQVAIRKSKKPFLLKEKFAGMLYCHNEKNLFNPGETAVIEWVPDNSLPNRSEFILKLFYVDSDSLANYNGSEKPFSTIFMTR